MAQSVSFFLDEQMHKAIAKGLRRSGIDVLTTAEAQMLGAEDEELLERASIEGRVFVTRDQDFLRLHSQAAGHAGITFVTPQRTIGDTLRGLKLIHNILEAADMKGRVEYI